MFLHAAVNAFRHGFQHTGGVPNFIFDNLNNCEHLPSWFFSTKNAFNTTMYLLTTYCIKVISFIMKRYYYYCYYHLYVRMIILR